MRRISVIILFLNSIHPVLNASTILPGKIKTPPAARDIMIPLAGTDKTISLEDFLTLTPASYKEMTGKKMNYGQRLDLSISKHYLKKMIQKDGTVDVEKMKRRGFFGGWQWHWGGFALGLFLSFLGPIVALFFNDDYKWDRFWSALHTAIWVGLLLGIILAVSAGGAY
jgi:hypothetical protein